MAGTAACNTTPLNPACPLQAALALIQRLVPEEMMHLVLSYLGPYTLGRVACVCQQWRQFAEVRGGVRACCVAGVSKRTASDKHRTPLHTRTRMNTRSTPGTGSTPARRRLARATRTCGLAKSLCGSSFGALRCVLLVLLLPQ